MSAGERQIECRTCKERIPLEAGDCPHCGTSILRLTPPIAAILLGSIVAGASLTNVGALWFYGLFGIAMVVIGSYLIYNRRQRIQRV